MLAEVLSEVPTAPRKKSVSTCSIRGGQYREREALRNALLPSLSATSTPFEFVDDEPFVVDDCFAGSLGDGAEALAGGAATGGAASDAALGALGAFGLSFFDAWSPALWSSAPLGRQRSAWAGQG